MTFVILTQSPDSSIFTLETCKKLLRKALKRNRGPQAVTSSVLRGLNSLNYKYRLNPKSKEIVVRDTIWINESIEALRWAISFKKNNSEVKLIVGPNLVVVPTDQNSIIFDKTIDVILQPSEWTKELYVTYNSSVASKIQIWPAGVWDPFENISIPLKENYFVVYQKNAPAVLFNTVLRTLQERKIDFKIIKYGSFKQEDYLALLEKSCGMIYLSTSESQGIALQEAWIRNVPTLVWDRGFWENKSVNFKHEQISCPYLTPMSGITFDNAANFERKIDEFIQRLPDFKARDYSIKNLTDKVTTLKLINIIQS